MENWNSRVLEIPNRDLLVKKESELEELKGQSTPELRHTYPRSSFSHT